MKIIRMSWSDGEGGAWITPLIGFSWKPKVFSIWLAWLYWCWQFDFSKDSAGISPNKPQPESLPCDDIPGWAKPSGESNGK